MTFGQQVRASREQRGWSRFHLTLAIKAKFRPYGITISETAIESIETGLTRHPRATTINLLVSVFPELGQTGPETHNNGENPHV